MLLIPTLAAVLLNGQRMQSALSSGDSYGRVERLVLAAHNAAALAHALQDERDLAVGSTAEQAQPRIDRARAAVNQAAAVVRSELTEVDGSRNTSLQADIASVVQALDRIASLRKASSTAARQTSVFREYTATIEKLLALQRDIGTESGNTKLASQAFALESLSKAGESVSQQRATLYAALMAGAFHGTSLNDFAVARAQRQEAIASFLSHASPAQHQRLQETVRGPDVEKAQQIESAVLAGRAADSLGVNAQSLFALMSRQLDLLRKVESSQFNDILSDIRQLRSGTRSGVLGGTIIYTILVFAMVATMLVVRSILRPLQTLRSAALDIAHRLLPDTVRQPHEGQGRDDMPTVGPIDVHSGDEIGEVARAFDAVHQQAVQLAKEQATMRTNIRAMFVNLSRRSQTLVQRQLQLIDKLENGEQDPDRLASLFKLDHLATRMRRNDENLLVLAGAEAGRKRPKPAPLLDVIRAASAEVEHYSRVHLDVQPGYFLAGGAVNDTVHLIAELLENATAYSPSETAVRVVARGLGPSGELMIEVHDEGIGMAADALATANEKLAAPSDVDASMSRMMGLFVVARLAHRQGIRVRLRPSSGGGITALVRLPAALVSQRGDDDTERQGSLGRVPEAILPLGAGASAPLSTPASGVTSSRQHPAPAPPPFPAQRGTVDELDGPWNATENPDTPAEAVSRTERLPIFEALQSEWFRRPPSFDAADGSAASAGSVAKDIASIWRSPGDEGWRAAASLSTQPATTAVTSAGLPKRVPGRNLVPGSAMPTANGRVPARPTADQARTLSSYQQGIKRARASSGSASDEPADATDRELSEDK